MSADRFLGVAVTPLTRRRIEAFKANRRGLWSLVLFLLLFVVSLFAELIAHVVADPANVTRVLPLTSVCRYLERIGDHVKNLAEHVVYMVRARDVRHRSVRPSAS